LNCKLRNNSYRLPEDNFYCGNRTKRTYRMYKLFNSIIKWKFINRRR
jgi:hypothetical protein